MSASRSSGSKLPRHRFIVFLKRAALHMPLDKTNDAFELMHTGQSIRTVIHF
ncbi:hypothetical protein [Pseudomonas sp. FW305-28]|uniref:hypothetical protein n=1 Tax=Pseudomonas sp. FW305-28 TaxID=2751326 RepID=UPI0013048FAB|nr:hypothetical protein [Pseudomonas sp. FW305-28]